MAHRPLAHAAEVAARVWRDPAAVELQFLECIERILPPQHERLEVALELLKLMTRLGQFGAPVREEFPRQRALTGHASGNFGNFAGERHGDGTPIAHAVAAWQERQARTRRRGTPAKGCRARCMSATNRADPWRGSSRTALDVEQMPLSAGRQVQRGRDKVRGWNPLCRWWPATGRKSSCGRRWQSVWERSSHSSHGWCGGDEAELARARPFLRTRTIQYRVWRGLWA